jgi:hypothetical protein
LDDGNLSQDLHNLDATKSVADNNQAVNEEVVDNDPPGDPTKSRSGFCFAFSDKKGEFPSRTRGNFLTPTFFLPC